MGFLESTNCSKFLKNEYEEIATAVKCGAYRAEADFGHTSPNSKQLVELGLCGLLKRVEKKIEQQKQLSKKQVEFYESCKIVLNSCISVCLRLAEAIAPYSSENESALRQIAQGSPTNSYEVMQLLIIYFFLHEYVFKTRVRTLGRLDILLYPYYKRDIESGRYSKAEIKEMLKFFLNKFSSAKVPFGLPFCLGGMDENGEDITNDISYLIVEAYQ